MKEPEMKQIAKMIAAVIREPHSEELKSRVRKEVAELAERFPLYPRRYKKVEPVSAG
jgi:glycine hydroxymethyltransferase